MDDNILIDIVEDSLIKSINGNSKIDDYLLNMEGMSGSYTRHLYNNLLSHIDIRYLEVGTWKGSSVCSAMCGNKSKVLCIDNWSEFGGPKNEFIENFEKYKGENDAEFIEQDCFMVDVKKIGKFNIFMFDGNHSYESHFKSLNYFYDCLDDEFIFIVDDWNWEVVRNATKDSIRHNNFEVIYTKEIRLNDDNTVTHSKETWWNGIGIFVLKKKYNEI